MFWSPPRLSLLLLPPLLRQRVAAMLNMDAVDAAAMMPFCCFATLAPCRAPRA